MKQLIFFIFLLIGVSAAGQFQNKVDFTRAKASIHVLPNSKEVRGNVRYHFQILESVDSVFLDAKTMQFSEVKLNKKKVPFLNNQKVIVIKNKFKKGKTYSLDLSFSAKPQQTVYFMGWDGFHTNNQVWTQGQGKYTSHWLPSFDDMNEKVEFDIEITFQKDYQVIANGKLIATKELDSLKTWSFDMEKPMSSYLLAFAIGNYYKKTATSLGGIPIEMHYYPNDSLNFEPTYRYTQQIFDFMESEIGVPYPWQNYKQIPVNDFLYAGMENTGTTIFSDAYVIDSIAFIDKNYVNVNAHELAHQWFGNLVTEVDSHHHWLHEGFATYYALLAEKELFGASYFYWKLFATANQLNEISRQGGGEALTNAKASSLTFYEKGAWALVILRELVGDRNFKKAIQNYLLTHKFKNVTISDFISEMQNSSGMDLSSFQQKWLSSSEFPLREVKEYLTKSSLELADFYTLQQEIITRSENKEELLKKYWDNSNSKFLKREIIATYPKLLSENFLQDGFLSEDVQIRQALALHLQQIPPNLKPAYESLLSDKSYLTIENALYKLWIYFPADRAGYLDKALGVEGFPNKNIRILWLTLAILTKDYHNDKKELYLGELRGYTASKYSFETRELAFQYLEETFEFSDTNLHDLINAATHHSWQFRKFARDLLDKILLNANYRKRINALKKELNEEELRYITTKLGIE